MTIKILLIGSQQLVREGLRAMLEEETNFCVVGEVGSGDEAAALVSLCKPDMVLADMPMVNTLGITEACRVVRLLAPVKVLVLSNQANASHISIIVRAGALGYMLTSSARKELVHAIHDVAMGKAVLPSDCSVGYAELSAQHFQESYTLSPGELSTREIEVLQLLGNGENVKQIAMTLHLSTKTIETHRAHIKKKLNLHCIAKLTKYAIREGLISPEL